MISHDGIFTRGLVQTWIGLTLMFGLLFCRSAIASQVWLAGVDPVSAHHRNLPEPDRQDFVGLFVPEAPWPNAAGHVAVFKTTAGVVLRMPEDIVSRIFGDLKRRHIALALEMEILGGTGGCGVGVGGFSAPGTFEVATRKVKMLGGDLRYVAMDEPLWWGHRYAGHNACKTPIRELAQEVGRDVHWLKSVFPDVEVGDIEPVGSPNAEGWLDDIANWMQAYREESGETLPFLHADVVWNGPWQGQLVQLAASVRSHGAKFGVIYNGSPQAETDIAWTREAEERMAEVESQLGFVPDQAILQTWMPRPYHMLPETQPGTMTYLVDRYEATPTAISVQRSGDALVGRLLDSQGEPVSHAKVAATATDNGSSPIWHVVTVTGTVPDTATAATIALRINVACNCKGKAEVMFRPIRYRDDKSGQELKRVIGKSDDERTIVQSTEKLSTNSPIFSVLEGNPYTLEVSMAASHSSSESGYIAINFLNRAGQQVGYRQIWFTPGKVPAGNGVTDTSGRFNIQISQAVASLHTSYMLEYTGDERRRLSYSYIP